MKYSLLFLILLSLVSSSYGQSIGKQLDQLSTQHEKALTAAAQKVDRQYLDQLNLLLRRAMATSDSDSIIKIKSEIAAVTAKQPIADLPAVQNPSAAKNKFDQTVWENSGGNKVLFDKNGKFQETVGATVLQGRWRLSGDSEATVARTDGTTWHFVISPDQTSLSRKEAPGTWSKVAAQAAPAKP